MTIQLGSLSLGWREILLAAALMLGIYMLFVAWLMRRLRRHALPKPAPVEPTVTTQGVAGAAAYAANAALGDAPDEGEAPAPQHPPSAPDPDEEASAPAEAGAPNRMPAELAQMRAELDALRAEFAALRAEVQQGAAQIKAAQSVSPLYSDAMQMAGAGHSAALIAERCGISRAEAELVVALVKSQG